MSIKLFLHSIRLVFNNLSTALRISALLYVLPLMASYAVLSGIERDTPRVVIFLYSLPVSIVAFICWLGIAVAWHRFILLDERPSGWVPPFAGRRMLAYFGYTMLLVLIAGVVVGAGIGLATVAFAGGPVMVLLAWLLTLFIALVIGYRLGLVLPASSLDSRLPIQQSWAATRGATGHILGLALLSTVASMMLGLPSLLFTGSMRPYAILWDVPAGWLTGMVGLSILTTLYGHYVEGRPVG